MKALKIIFITIGILVVLALISLWYVGFFTTIKIQEKEAGGYVVAGEEFTGSYMKVEPTMKRVDSILKTSGITCSKGFGIYYDNPKETPQEKCRSFVGNIIEDKDTSRIEAIKALGLKVENISKAQAMVIEFPIKGKFSYMVGPIKAYPVFHKNLKEKNYKMKLAMEVYDMPNKNILFIMQYQK